MTIAVQYSDVVIITTALTKASNQGWGSVSDCLLHRVMPELDPKDEGWARHGDEEEGSAGKRSRSEKTTGQAPLPFKCTGRCRELAKKLEMEEQPTTGGFQARGDCWVFMSYTQPKPTVAEGRHTEPILHPPYIYTLPVMGRWSSLHSGASLSPPLDPRPAMGLAMPDGVLASRAGSCLALDSHWKMKDTRKRRSCPCCSHCRWVYSQMTPIHEQAQPRTVEP